MVLSVRTFWSEEDEAFIAIFEGCEDRYAALSAFGDTEEEAKAELLVAYDLAREISDS